MEVRVFVTQASLLGTRVQGGEQCDEHMCRDQVELYKTGLKRDACGYKAYPFRMEWGGID
jgi:hypothetical protein